MTCSQFHMTSIGGNVRGSQRVPNYRAFDVADAVFDCRLVTLFLGIRADFIELWFKK